MNGEEWHKRKQIASKVEHASIGLAQAHFKYSRLRIYISKLGLALHGNGQTFTQTYLLVRCTPKPEWRRVVKTLHEICL